MKEQDQVGDLDLSDDIAIIGMAGRFPGAASVEQFWSNLKDGIDSITRFSDEELHNAGVDLTTIKDDQSYVKAGGILPDAEEFDAAFFGYNKREAESTDPQHRVLLECTWDAFENAGYVPDQFPGLIGVFVGKAKNRYFLSHLLPHRERVSEVEDLATLLGNESDYLATKISYLFNLRGPSVNIHTACSTSLVAIYHACQSLLNHQCDLAIAGGVAIRVPQRAGYRYHEGHFASPDGRTRAYDINAQGTVFTNGAGIVVLKRLEDAIAYRDTISAVIKGIAINNDGSSKVGFMAPSVNGQAEVIAMAQAAAGVHPEEVSYVEGHGTATPLGDPIEVAALTQAFRSRTDKTQFCALGSVKSNIGHLDAAAGVTGIIKTALALHHKILPPSLHFEKPNPKFDIETTPFYVNHTLQEWDVLKAPRKAGVSSFGVGGTNAHAVLAEAPASESSNVSRPWHVLTLSAKTRGALEATTANLIRYLEANPASSFADTVYTLQVGRKTFSHRRVVVCSDRNDAVQVLSTDSSKRILTEVQEQRDRPVAFMFPGQGAQYVNMALELYEQEQTFRQTSMNVHES